jgi:hypothetical protein
MDDLTQADVTRALGAAVGVWYALAADDDAEVARLLCDEALVRFRPGAGLASRIRAHLGVTMEECRGVGTLDAVEMLPAGRLRPAFVVERGQAGLEDVTFAFELAERKRRWWVDPAPTGTTPAIGTVLLED